MPVADDGHPDQQNRVAMKKLIPFIFVTSVVLVVAVRVMSEGNEATQPTPTNSQTAEQVGLSVNSPKAYQGYTLLAPMNSTSTYLIDMEGRIVNEWKSEYTPALSAYLLDNGHLLRPCAEHGHGHGGPGTGGRIQELTWDGELVWDYAFDDIELRPHHDICPLPNGNVLVIAGDPKPGEEAIAQGLLPTAAPDQFEPDCLLEIKPTGPTSGKIVWRWHAWDHLIQDVNESLPNYGQVSEHPELIDINFGSGMMDEIMRDPEQVNQLRSLGYLGGDRTDQEPQPARSNPEDQDAPAAGSGRPSPGPKQGDWMHVNFVAYNAKLDQIMLSVHEFSEVWIIDHSTTTAEAAAHAGGKYGHGGDLLYRWGNPQAYRYGDADSQRLFAQHHAHWIPEGYPGAGNMLVFNNGAGRPDGAYSSVDQIELPVNEHGEYTRRSDSAYSPGYASWSYTADDKKSFFSMLISSARRLPNGNTLICSGNQARLFEVTPEAETVWEYQHPGGGAGGPGGMPRPGELIPKFLQQALAMTKPQLEILQPLQARVDKTLESMLSEAQLQMLKEPWKFRIGQPGRGGGPGPGSGPPRFGSILPEFFVDALELTPAQQTEYAKLQMHVDDVFMTLWTDRQLDQVDELQRQFRRGPGGGPPPGFGPPPRDGRPGRDPRQPDPHADHRPPRGPNGPGWGPGPGGPGAPGGPGGPGGIFCCFRYGPNYPGLAGKELTPGKMLAEVVLESLKSGDRNSHNQPAPDPAPGLNSSAS
jgi:hypothetical protein